MAGEGPFHASEKVEHVGRLEDSAALPTDIALAQYAGFGEGIDGIGNAGLGPADQSGGRGDGDDRDARQARLVAVANMQSHSVVDCDRVALSGWPTWRNVVSVLM